MVDGADLRDIELLAEFERFLKTFRDRLSTRCDEIRGEFSKTTEWLEGEAMAYWKGAFRQAEFRFSEARDALSLCRAKVRPDDHEACSEQEKAFHKAKARLALCEAKLKLLKAAQTEWAHFSGQAMTRVAESTDLVETQLPQMESRLAAILTTLEKYRQG